MKEKILNIDSNDADNIKNTSGQKKLKTQNSKVCKCKVVNYNPHSGTVVFEFNGKLQQSNNIKYDGTSGFIDWKY